MQSPLQYLVPLSSGFIYAVAAITLKRATSGDAGPWRVNFVTNGVQALVFAPLWFLGDQPFAWTHFWHAAIAGAAFFVGLVFTFLALSRGDVSIATPVLGTKVILVAFFSVLLLGEPLPLPWWGAAVLATIATALLGIGPRRAGTQGGFLVSLGFGLGAAASFALCDVLHQKWAAAWGFARFAPVVFGTVAVLSFLLVPLFRAPLRSLKPETWRWLAPGAVLIAMQALGIAYSIVVLGGATYANILYASRGVWTVVLIWTIGHWFQNDERSQGHGVMGMRLAGSGLLIAAIALVLR